MSEQWTSRKRGRERRVGGEGERERREGGREEGREVKWDERWGEEEGDGVRKEGGMEGERMQWEDTVLLIGCVPWGSREVDDHE